MLTFEEKIIKEQCDSKECSRVKVLMVRLTEKAVGWEMCKGIMDIFEELNNLWLTKIDVLVVDNPMDIHLYRDSYVDYLFMYLGCPQDKSFLCDKNIYNDLKQLNGINHYKQEHIINYPYQVTDFLVNIIRDRDNLSDHCDKNGLMEEYIILEKIGRSLYDDMNEFVAFRKLTYRQMMSLDEDYNLKNHHSDCIIPHIHSDLFTEHNAEYDDDCFIQNLDGALSCKFCKAKYQLLPESHVSIKSFLLNCMNNDDDLFEVEE